MKPSEPEYVIIGEILSSWGSDGYLKVRVTTDFPERFTASSEVWLNGKPARIEDVVWRRGQAVIKLDTVNDIGTADRLRGQFLEIPHSQLKDLPEGEYYHFQLVGLEVRTTGGETLGEIADILTMTSNDTYVVRGDKGEILIPAIEDVVQSVDLENGLVIIEPMKGLLGLNEKKSGK